MHPGRGRRTGFRRADPYGRRECIGVQERCTWVRPILRGTGLYQVKPPESLCLGPYIVQGC